MKVSPQAKEIIRKRWRREGRYTFFKPVSPGHLLITKYQVGLNDSADFKKELLIYANSYNGDIYVDMRNLHELDTSGISVLVQAAKIVRRNGNKLCLENLQKKPMDLANIEGIEEILNELNLQPA